MEGRSSDQQQQQPPLADPSRLPPLPPHHRHRHRHRQALTELPAETSSRLVEKEKGSATASTSRGNMIRLERNRREKMNEFYRELQSMVPKLFPKATRARIVDETIAYIRELEEQSIKLTEATKKAKVISNSLVPSPVVHKTPTVNAATSGKMATFSISSMSRPGLATQILQVFEDHKSEVLVATVACTDGQNMNHGQVMNLTVTAMIPGEEATERIQGELMSILS